MNKNIFLTSMLLIISIVNVCFSQRLENVRNRITGPTSARLGSISYYTIDSTPNTYIEWEASGAKITGPNHRNNFSVLWMDTASEVVIARQIDTISGAVTTDSFHVRILPSNSVTSSFPKLVVIEEGTNSSCIPCGEMAPEYKSLLQEFGDVVIPISYHLNFPSPYDPMYVSAPELHMRMVNYYGAESIPRVFLNGLAASLDIPVLKNQIMSQETELSPISMTLEQQEIGDSIRINISILSNEKIDHKTLRIAAIERYVYFANKGGNGETEFEDVARKMMPDPSGIPISLQPLEKYERTIYYHKEAGWNSKRIYSVAFIQDDSTHEILQGATTIKKDITATLIPSERFGHINPNTTKTVTIIAKNSGTDTITAVIIIDHDLSDLPSGWKVQLPVKEVSIPPGGVKNIDLQCSATEKAGLATIILTIEPQGSEIFSLPYSTRLFLLSSNTSIGILNSTHEGGLQANKLLELISESNSKYADESGVLPMVDSIIRHYPPSQFATTVLCLNETSFGFVFGIHDPDLISEANAILDAKKNLMIIAPQGLSPLIPDSLSGFSNIRDFANRLGIQSADFKPRYNTDIVPFKINGMAGDILGGGIESICNEDENYTLYTDILHLKKDGSSTPFLFYDDDSSNIGGIYNENDGVRLVYLTTGLESMSNAEGRNTLTQRIISWLNHSLSVPRNIPTNKSSLDIWPNPILTSSTISITVPIGNAIEIRLFDILGNNIKTIANFTAKKIQYEFELSISTLPSGTYFLQMQNGAEITTRTVKVK